MPRNPSSGPVSGDSTEWLFGYWMGRRSPRRIGADRLAVMENCRQLSNDPVDVSIEKVACDRKTGRLDLAETAADAVDL